MLITHRRGAYLDMEIFLDCLPCVLKQVLEAARMSTQNQTQQAEIMEEAVKLLQNHKNYSSSPEIVGDMHAIVRKITGVEDPYKAIKDRDIEAAKQAYPMLLEFAAAKNNDLHWAVKIAATGNIIDSAIYDTSNFRDSLETELAKEFSHDDFNIFSEQLKSASNLLIIGDNSGETIFDKVLIEHLPNIQIEYAVRSGSIINDATISEAEASGLNQHAKLISTGCRAPGAVLEQCSPEFISKFYSADIVISKGQGNYEALSECDRPVFFLLKAKCPMVADILKVKLNDYVFMYHAV
jgi:uncharacterized protein with ATP-grasp and redox domains